MAGGHHHDTVTSHLPSLRRLALIVLVCTALITGYLGFRTYLAGNVRFGRDPLDLTYDDLQLFVLGPFPLQDGGAGPYPLMLQIGRFTAPIVTVYAIIEAGRLFLANELNRLRTRRARGHAVVCGTGLMANVLADRLGAAGQRVVVVACESPESRYGRRDQVCGDPRTPEVLEAAGLSRATSLYACTSDTTANTVIALAASKVARDVDSRLAVYAHVGDPDLCLALQARHLGLPRPLHVALGFFNVDELAARQLFVDSPSAIPARHVLVVGASAFGRAVITELGRQWRMAGVGRGRRPTVTVIDEHASSVVGELVYRYRFLDSVCRLRPHDGGITALIDVMNTEDRPQCAYICYDDEERGMKTALTVDQLWHGGRRSIVVRLDRLAQLREAFDGANGDPLLDEVSGSLHLFGVVDAACDPKLIRDDLVERLARIIHDRYRLARIQRGECVSGPSMAEWDQLPVMFRRSNRAQAEDIGRKLDAIGCVLAPRVLPGEERAPSGAAIELLAQMEHQRWLDERSRAGWRYSDRRDDDRLTHPDLRPWEELSEIARDKNRDAVRELAAIVDDAGFRVVKV